MLSDTDIRAIYTVAADWHGGQGSRGYRLLSRAYRIMQRRGMIARRDEQVSPILICRSNSKYARWADAVTNCEGF